MRRAPSVAVAALALAVALGLALAACGGSKNLATPAECNPLGGVGCALPWPSALYEKADPASPTGVRLDFAAGTLPTSSRGVALDPATFNGRTGFSPATQIATAFPVQVDGANLVDHEHIPDSLTDASPTVILDMSTGQRVPHWAELDVNATDPTDQALYLRPAVRLSGGTRYAVAIRRALHATGGAALPVPEGFAEILDGEKTTHARLEAIRPRYDDIFAALATAGVPKSDLVVAWDFVTGSDDELTADMLGARDAALAAMGDRGANLTYKVTLDQAPDTADSRIARLVEFDFDSPNLLVGDGQSGLNRGPDGKPMVAGTVPSHAAAIVPPCATAQNKVPILIFGHGFFGGTSELEGEYLRRVARDLCVVAVGGTWRGMSLDDLGIAAKALNNGNLIPFFGQRIVQGVVDFIALEQLVRGKLATSLFVDGTGASIVDPTRVYFLGISQGGILGSTFTAYDPFVTRSTLMVGGGDWSLLFERSTNWATFSQILAGAYDGHLTMVVMEQLLQMGFDDTDPIHVAPKVLRGGMPGTPPKQLLHQITLGDAQVSNLASELQSRTIGLTVLAPAVTVPYGLTEGQAGAMPSSALTIWDTHPTPLPPSTNLLNGTDNGAHGNTRKYQAVVDQMGHFFTTGEVIQTCTSTGCDCAAGDCGPLGE